MGGSLNPFDSGGGGSTTTEYIQSPEQREMYNLVMPIMQRISAQANKTPIYGDVPASQDYSKLPYYDSSASPSPSGAFDPNTGEPIIPASYQAFGAAGGPPSTERQIIGYEDPEPLWNLDPYPTMGDVISDRYGSSRYVGSSSGDIPDLARYQTYGAEGQLSQIPTYNIPEYQTPEMYDIPSTEGLMPTEGWYEGLDPNIKAGLWEPYNEQQQQLMNRMGATGQAGSTKAGWSGAAGSALGEQMRKATGDVSMQAWDMISPIQQSEWLAELERSKTGYEDLTEQRQLEWMGELERSQTDYQNLLDELQSEYVGRQKDWQYKTKEETFPYEVLPAFLGGTYSTPLVTQEQPYTFGQGVSDASSIMSAIMMAKEMK